jgi:hypothetical protein
MDIPRPEEFIEKKLKKIPEGGSNQDLDGRWFWTATLTG